LATFALVLYKVGRYFRDSKQLRRFPSPSIAGFSPVWYMWHAWKGQQYRAVYEAHQRLGPVVWIAPNHLSFTDPAAYKDIYGHGASVIKDDFYSHLANGNPSLSQATDKTIHSAKRRNLAHIFSAKEITAMEPRVMELVESLCSVLKVKSMGGSVGKDDKYPVTNGVFDVRPWLNMFAYDAVSSMFFTNVFGFLGQGNDLCKSIDKAGNVKTVHAMNSFHSASRFNTTLGQLPLSLYKLGRQLLFFVPGNKEGSDFEGMSRAQVYYRLEHEPAERDLFSGFPIKASEKRPVPMPVAEAIAECATMLDAGNDTTQTSLTNCIYHLARNPEKQRKLYDTLAAALPEEYKTTKVVPSSVLQNVPYLRAVLEENWRCRPPVARGLPRRTTEEGAVISGHIIPPGVTVSASIYSLHRDESLFRQPLEFIPERWIPEDTFGADKHEPQNLKQYCIPFSMGPRACIGRNLAYMEVAIVIAALVLNFEWELAQPEMEYQTVERFNWNPRDLMVKARIR
jgi:benzoate 4-monooxygenase